MTTGGTESIMMACKAFRDYGRAEKGIRKPEIVIPTTAHAAFDKAAQYLGLRVRYVPVNPTTTQADLEAMNRAINSNTVLVSVVFDKFLCKKCSKSSLNDQTFFYILLRFFLNILFFLLSFYSGNTLVV